MRKLIINRKTLTVIIATVTILALIGGITLAVLKTTSNPIKNTFSALSAGVEAEEEFDGTVKKDVNAKNTGNCISYIRIKLTTYRVKDKDSLTLIGGEATIPEFTPGDGWLNAGNDTYIYSKPVKPNEKPEKALIGSDGITLEEYKDADGGVQVVDVIAEAIQSTPSDAVEEAWGVKVAADGTLSLKGE